jgi:carboxypeptidase C (cathepsin A)
MSDAQPDKDAKPADAEADKRARARVDTLLARAPATADGSVTLADGTRLDYRSHAAFVPVTPEGMDAADPSAAVFTVAYLAKVDGTAPRPLMFAFNGGPGSASIWLHLGALGPKRVRIPDDGTMPPPPYAVVDNPLTWLRHFDIVFVDPPHTGHSTTASAELRKTMLSVDGDVAALAEVVRAWCARHARFGSPLYLAGESYGTTRGAALADKLQEMGIALAGLVLVSCAMDLQSLVFAPRNDLPHALFLPAFAQVAQYHGRLKGPLARSAKDAREAAEAFVAEEYLAALHAGARLDGRARERIEKRLAELSGLPLALVREKNIRPTDGDFFFGLLRDLGRQVGRLEARVAGPMPARRDWTMEFDPGIEALAAPYTLAALAYFNELGVTLESRYEVLSHDAHKAWNWNRGEDKGLNFTSTSSDLARALRRNPHLRVLVASGRYDLGTPYSASDWSLAQLDAPPEVLARITHRYYDAGHMMYTREADLRQLADDLAAWMAGS